ncbi:MAG: RsmD family RNA methyltransferase, partial [Clostridia bacterium]|nr:RsmD family RNA methyltransferase [Clostridia bacterium]
MRIVSGKFRAKKLCPPSHDIRPTLDKVKQALFTKLQFQIECSAVLDLFSGSGALGIEAISRGARKVVFVDSNTKSIDLTKKNVSSLKLDGACKIEIKKSDFLTYLESAKEKFD